MKSESENKCYLVMYIYKSLQVFYKRHTTAVNRSPRVTQRTSKQKKAITQMNNETLPSEDDVEAAASSLIRTLSSVVDISDNK